jgi:hypothetical protein
LLQAAFRGDVVPKGSAEDLRILTSKEYGASYALLELAKELGLDRALYSRKEAWVKDCLAMIVGRIIYAGSKLALSNQWKNTALWELSGVEGKVDVELHCYLPMDRLLERQSAIQRTLAARHLHRWSPARRRARVPTPGWRRGRRSLPMSRHPRIIAEAC